MQLSLDFQFNAAMALPGYDGICGTPHGYDFVLTLWCSAAVGREKPWIVDIVDVEQVVQREVLEPLDDAYLNDFVDYPALEGVVIWIADRLFNTLDAATKLQLRAGGRYAVTLDRQQWEQL